MIKTDKQNLTSRIISHVNDRFETYTSSVLITVLAGLTIIGASKSKPYIQKMDDVVIESIVQMNNKYADTNHDGKITEKESYDLLNRFMEKNNLVLLPITSGQCFFSKYSLWKLLEAKETISLINNYKE